MTEGYVLLRIDTYFGDMDGDVRALAVVSQQTWQYELALAEAFWGYEGNTYWYSAGMPQNCEIRIDDFDMWKNIVEMKPITDREAETLKNMFPSPYRSQSETLEFTWGYLPFLSEEWDSVEAIHREFAPAPAQTEVDTEDWGAMLQEEVDKQRNLWENDGIESDPAKRYVLLQQVKILEDLVQRNDITEGEKEMLKYITYRLYGTE